MTTNMGEQVAFDDSGRCVTIQVSRAGQAAMWLVAIGLMAMGTFGDIDDAKGWALLCSAVAASWTIIDVLAYQQHQIDKAFELGRASAEAASKEGSIRPVR